MDAQRFARLARGVTSARSRRGVLGILGSGALAVSMGLGRPRPAEGRCRRGTNCNKDRNPRCQNNSQCQRFKNVDTRRCACVVVTKCGEPCTTSAECGGELCVFGRGCCNETGKFCAPPCPTIE